MNFMNFKLTHSDGNVSYVTLELAGIFQFQACEFLEDMNVGDSREDNIGDVWERIE